MLIRHYPTTVSTLTVRNQVLSDEYRPTPGQKVKNVCNLIIAKLQSSGLLAQQTQNMNT